MAGPVSSLQQFGLNRFPQPHSVVTDANQGFLLPLLVQDCPIRSVIDNEVDLFSRSSPLVDPAFLDADISVGHYFVAYEAMDPLYKSRIRNFKSSLSDVKTPQLTIPLLDLYAAAPDTDGSYPVHNYFGPGSLFDRLGFSISPSVPEAFGPSSGSVVMNLYPFLAYHMICDWYFTNRNMDNCYRTVQMVHQLLEGSLKKLVFSLADISTAFSKADAESGFDHNAGFINWILRDLRSCNFAPDYFTAARRKASGSDVYLPGTTNNPAKATVHNLLDAELIQKVADMLYEGGYSYNDFVRILFDASGDASETENPQFLGGTTMPLQVSTVVQQADSAESPLGSQAGNVSAYINGQNRIHKVVTRPGIYMVLAWIRPHVYYTAGIDRIFSQTSIADGVIPQFADMTNAPIFQYELNGDAASFAKGPETASIFGYADRYESYRTRVNRAQGSMRTTRRSWFLSRGYNRISAVGNLVQSPAFITMGSQADYSPWLVTDRDTPHFFLRAYHNFTMTHLLPAKSRPYVW